jgi:hypothetical protein
MGRRKSAQLRELASALGCLYPSAVLPEDAEIAQAPLPNSYNAGISSQKQKKGRHVVTAPFDSRRKTT